MLNTLYKTLFSGRTAYFVGFVVSFGLVALALWIQTTNSLEPCPLCISQRIVFMALGTLFLLAAIFNPKNIGRLFFALLQVGTALGGAGVAVRHWWLQAHKESMIADCGVGFDYMFENFPLQKALTLVFKGTGDCAAIDWTLFGITLPQLAFIAFVGLAAFAIQISRK